MWGLHGPVNQQTEGPFSWSNTLTNPKLDFLCTLIMQQTHAYARADHIISAEALCEVINIAKEHVTWVDQYKEWLHNSVTKGLADFFICVDVSWSDPEGVLLCPYNNRWTLTVDTHSLISS